MAIEHQLTVLMADDDDEDCMLAAKAFSESGVNVAFSCVEDGVQLMDYLAECSGSSPEELPELILLDLNMPRKDGREALIEIKAKPAFQNIPIIILSTSKEEKDVVFSLTAGAKGFITKPATFDEWVEMMKSLADFYLR